MDPFGKIKSVALHYLAGSQGQDQPKPTALLETMSRCRKLPLKVENQLASGGSR